jgi:hypothetical protein
LINRGIMIPAVDTLMTEIVHMFVTFDFKH